MDEKVTRRGVSLIVAGLGIRAGRAQTQKPGTTIHQEIDYNTTPARLYEALLDPKQFAAFTKAAAEIDPQPGGAFKLFGGAIEGRNVELVADRRIVQAWRPASWPAGVYSIARFDFAASGAGTRVVFDHVGFTEDKWEHLNSGWVSNYWTPLHKYLNA
jgi:activator of HSP90 ATPase